jgi:hypothetical protein
MVVALGRTVVADWTHSSDQGLLYMIVWLNTFGSTRSRRNIAAVADYAAVDSALLSLEVLQKDVDFRAFADHP